MNYLMQKMNTKQRIKMLAIKVSKQGLLFWCN